MAIIYTYQADSTISDDDLLLGTDASSGSNVTRTYSIGALADYIGSNSGVIVDTNYYLDGITPDSNTGIITFSINGATNQTLTLGTAAFSNASDFAEDGHTHTISDIISANAITTTYLDVSGTGNSGQILTSDGTGGFVWANASALSDTNFYLNGITQSGNTLTFTVNGAANQSFEFGEAAFLSINTVIDQVAQNITIADVSTDLGDLSVLDSVNTSYIDNNAITANKIQSDAVTEPKLKTTNSATSGYVLTSDGGDGFTWAFNSASNYYIDNVTKVNNTLTFELAGGIASSSFPTYTFGDGAFLNIGTSSGTVAEGNHTHAISDFTGVGTLAILDEVDTAEILDNAVTAIKLSPSVGTNGQVLSVDSSGNLEWVTITATITNFLTLPDTPSNFTGAGGNFVKVNSGETGVEFVAAGIDTADINTTNSASANKILGVDSNGDLEWTNKSTSGTGIIVPTSLSGIATNGTAGQLIQTDGDGTFSYVNVNTFDGAFSSLTGTPTTIAGYGITDAFDGQFSSLTSKPTTIAGYGITDAVTSINDLSDVDTVTQDLTNGKVLTWNSTNSEWEPEKVTYSSLGNEFKTVASAITLSSGTTTATLDFTSAAVFQVTLPSDATNTSIVYSNNEIGMTKIIKVTGSGGTGTPTITGTLLSGTLDQTNATVNYIQVTCLGASEFIYTISQA